METVAYPNAIMIIIICHLAKCMVKDNVRVAF